ncbi:3-phosphoserine/phosphohydroxythreonine transaminase [Polynucleobacter paneuropaeus]|jgi:phosphoserine aminotransferase|uniref:3-phosphoserine/phosphohydroxythreonine transaminase n=1 Tax=Polynucleobacter paneuropaeus TaxID=2527775 RepID=UPI001BFE34D0|nr:3-phosphoserine/phosphohydroxythreonine transaminase [Polynucleobacter paneuropaeus]MBT8516504.1 3-phosphoserine/phosphohydroxythreonine transaminase [Polynucleobacter paneuropaeus]MBT8554740.1 3-phosphoserine/phosphohydroxythreonine transaminase [Polynucleobacter paneuropaeus]MBT8560017.1 3-phosphoserine/phosphohydroxythreonine transaminase [Polynucleobacter paneuropaeus]MBT8572466.1 3-phosphoserine/phosphohydroxythreonine transaminase [Polynucleobacter paneuropaeus]MBT8606122.1 3-phosphos
MTFDRRIFNFAAGPATLPEETLRQAADEMLNWHGLGSSVMEISHRSKEFMAVYEETLHDLRTLMNIPNGYEILLLQGGGIGQNAAIPMNLMGLGKNGPKADFIVTGIWSEKSFKEAQKYGVAHLAASSEAEKFTTVTPRSAWNLSSDAAYVHICANETIGGVEFDHAPDVGNVPLVADVSSNILSKEMDVSQYGVLFAGAQKNIGPSGVTIVIVRKDLLGHCMPITPSVWDWAKEAANQSMLNTPPTFAIYMAGLSFKWLLKQGGVKAIAKQNQAKADLLYECIDQSSLYENRIAKLYRSRMNVTFFLKDEALNAEFLAQSHAAGLVALRGHKAVGGMRASIYNAMPIEGVKALVEFMRDFERRA